MRISTLTWALFGLMLSAAMTSGGLTLWHSAQGRIWDQRIGLAQASYAEHLALQSNIYQLFKQHGDALLFGDRDGGAMEADLRARITGNLAAIRQLVGREIDLVGAEEIGELTQLSRIEGKVAALTQRLATLNQTGAPVDEVRRRETLIAILDGEIDDRLALRITEALDGERAEVAATLAEGAAFRARIRAPWPR